MVEIRLDPKFKVTGKDLLGQQLQPKGDTVSTKVSDWLSEQQPGKVLKEPRWESNNMLKHIGDRNPRKQTRRCS